MSDTSAPSVPPPVRDSSVMTLAPLIMAVLATLGLFGLIGILAFHTIPEGNKDAMLQLTGVLGTAFGTGIGYFLGSSVSSRAKDQAISNLSK